jgi:hypothetical protein
VEAGRTASGQGDVGSSTILERLARVIDPDYVPVWLDTPIPALGGEKPSDLLARGDVQPVLQVISELESPAFS